MWPAMESGFRAKQSQCCLSILKICCWKNKKYCTVISLQSKNVLNHVYSIKIRRESLQLS